jgi:hypothetical protein
MEPLSSIVSCPPVVEEEVKAQISQQEFHEEMKKIFKEMSILKEDVARHKEDIARQMNGRQQDVAVLVDLPASDFQGEDTCSEKSKIGMSVVLLSLPMMVYGCSQASVPWILVAGGVYSIGLYWLISTDQQVNDSLERMVVPHHHRSV